jgi:hypothetical protein
VGEGGGEGAAVDAELVGGLPQPDLIGELVGGLSQLPALPVHARRGEGVAPKPAALGRQGAAEHAVILVEPVGRLDREVQAVVADLAAGADGLGLGRLGLLTGLGEEPLRVQVAASGPVQPYLPAVVLDHQRPLRPVDGGVAVGGAQGAEHLPDSALADPDQAGHIGEREPLAALGLPQPPELLDAGGVGQRTAPERAEGAANIVLAHADLLGDLDRVELLTVGDLMGLVELLYALQRPPRRRRLLELGSAAIGVGGLQHLELLGGWAAVAGRLGPQTRQPPVSLLAGAEGVQPLAGDRRGGADLAGQLRGIYRSIASKLAGQVRVGDPVADQPAPQLGELRVAVSVGAQYLHQVMGEPGSHVHLAGEGDRVDRLAGVDLTG